MTGPDEYSALADDNVYTNLMAQRNLRAAAGTAERYLEEAGRLGVGQEERAAWQAAAEAMYVPYDDHLGVHPQAEGFTTYQVWDFEHTKPEQYPLFLHFPYFDLYRRQVVKQADLVLAMVFRGDAFTEQQKARNFAYYEALTVRDSSLSACTQAVIAAEVGHLQLAGDYLAEAALMDLDDLEHNTRDGLHVASLAGTWIALVAGLAGMREHDDTLSFKPRLPSGITRLTVNLCLRASRLRVKITAEAVTYQLTDGPALRILHHEEPIEVAQDSPVTRPIARLPFTTPLHQPQGRAPHRREASERLPARLRERSGSEPSPSRESDARRRE
jgi:alpha,alpha-trehalose phosphorylase